MSKLKIKVCGMRDSANIRELVKLKPDLAGFVLYPDSPRFAGDVPAKGVLSSILSGIIKTGVFVDAEIVNIKERAASYRLDAVQLHGNESPELCNQLLSVGLKVIKAFRVDDSTDFSKMNDYVPCTTWFLFDTASGIPGGSGKQFNWELLESYNLGHPFFLSGGICPGDADRILSIEHPSLIGVDINSKFEKEPGIKDIGKVGEFIKKIRGK